MADPIDFYFDFSSPYGYLAAQRIDAIAAAAGRSVAWRPFLLGIAFKQTGAQPLVEVPMKRDYAHRDMIRSARRLGVPFVWPEPFPFLSVAACRAYYWFLDRDAAQARELARALYRRAFGAGERIDSAARVVEAAAELGLEAEALRHGLAGAELKDRLRREVEAALDRGVFGSPFVIVDGEPFWGHDRLEEVARWLETGGW